LLTVAYYFCFLLFSRTDSKLESGKVEILVKEVNFQETIGAVIHLVKTSQIALDKRLDIIAEFDPLLPECIATDSRRVQQILYNLLGNAIKFSNEDSKIDFNVSIADDKKMLVLSVKDYGKGIGSEDYTKIFEPFRQSVTGLTNTVGGTGLGLSITKKLVEAMDGTISVDSDVGSWTDFKVEIPFVDRPINIEELSDRLGSTSIFFVADETDPQTTLVQNIFAAFKVQYAHFHNMDDLVTLISSEKGLVPEMTYICLVHEDLYDAKSFELLKENSRSCVVTFGPKYGVEKTRKHWRSLMEVFPSVLIQYLGDFGQELLGNPAKACSRALGDEGDELISGLRILIAEDNLVNQKVMKRLLNRCGVTMVTIANNGLEAVEMEANQPFDLILMDMQMPKMDGVEACRALNKRDGGHPIPKVIFVTAHVSDSFRQYCIDNGAAGYLPKPCSLDSIREVLRHMVGYGSRFSFEYTKSWNKVRHSSHSEKKEPPSKSLTYTTTK
jgi:two-component system sensor histidine kinase/response regulator